MLALFAPRQDFMGGGSDGAPLPPVPIPLFKELSAKYLYKGQLITIDVFLNQVLNLNE